MTIRPVRIADSLGEAFECHAENVAVVDGAEGVTYRELNARRNQAACALRMAGVQQDDRVCLLLPKSIGAIAVLLGILDVGAVYVPLDCKTPPTRLSSMMRSCAPCWIITDGPHDGLLQACLQALEEEHVIGTFRLDTRLTLVHTEAVPKHGGGGAPPNFCNLAYILFTSGSTGQPKGVPIQHESVIDYIAWANTQFRVRPSDRISSHAPLHFDMSVWDIFGTLAAGAELHLVPVECNLSPQAMAGFIRSASLTQWYSVPSVLVMLANTNVLRQDDFPQLERIIWGGEALPVPVLRYWMERIPHATFTNVYGPTEATVNCAFHTLSELPADDAFRVPIGAPLPGRRLRLLDHADADVGPDEVGYLHVGGAGLSPGYWCDQSKTDAAFYALPSEPDFRWYRTGDLAHRDNSGLYYFDGRADRQIKSRGYRIELDDVAAALWRVPSVEECAVVAVSVAGLEGMRICAAYVSKRDVPSTPTETKAALSRLLPAYMLPRRWLALDSLPKTMSGKVDLRALSDMFANG